MNLQTNVTNFLSGTTKHKFKITHEIAFSRDSNSDDVPLERDDRVMARQRRLETLRTPNRRVSGCPVLP